MKTGGGFCIMEYRRFLAEKGNAQEIAKYLSIWLVSSDLYKGEVGKMPASICTPDYWCTVSIVHRYPEGDEYFVAADVNVTTGPFSKIGEAVMTDNPERLEREALRVSFIQVGTDRCTFQVEYMPFLAKIVDAMIGELKPVFSVVELGDKADVPKPIAGEPMATNVGDSEHFWERIPDISDNRLMLRLWREGYQSPEIGKRLGIAPKTVLNRLSDLRRQFGAEIVPIRRGSG
jgi:hypothetical protein